MIRTWNMAWVSSLRARIFWWLIPIICVLFILLGLADLDQQKRIAHEEIRARAKSMAENLAYSSRLAVFTEDRWLLEAALQGITGSADFAYVWIYGENFRPLIHSAGRRVDLKHFNPALDNNLRDHLSRQGEPQIYSLSSGTEKYLEYVVPITTVQSTVPYEQQIESRNLTETEASKTRERTIGAVRLGLSLSRIDAQIASFLRWRGGSLAIFLILSTLAIYIFSVRITGPINRLTAQAKAMSHGTLEQTIPVESHDEIGQLATSFNEMAQSLNKLYADLERKVAERTNELTTVNQKLAEASEHKSRFLANVNHELRTPLGSIIGYARLLRRETEGQISPLQKENLDDLLRNADRLLGLIDSLLDLAKIEAGKMDVKREPICIGELFEGTVATIEPMLDKNAVRLVRNIPQDLEPLYTDREKLRHVLLNLLSNAVKFTAQGEIRVSAWQVNGDINLAVTDTGIGIDQEDLTRIFAEFDRGRLSHDGQYRGTGLGLAIAKRLVDLLGGTIAVQSETGEGSTFTVTLPVKPQIAHNL